MNNTIVIGGKVISGEDMEGLIAQANEQIEIKQLELMRAYGHGGWR